MSLEQSLKKQTPITHHKQHQQTVEEGAKSDFQSCCIIFKMSSSQEEIMRYVKQNMAHHKEKKINSNYP